MNGCTVPLNSNQAAIQLKPVLISGTCSQHSTHTGLNRESMAKPMSERMAISEKVKVVCDFREYREWQERLRHNMDDFRVGVIKNVVLGAI